MATGVEFNAFKEAVAEGVHNLGSHTLKIMLTNTAPNPATDNEKADLTEITPGNGYVAGGGTVTITSSGLSGGNYVLAANNVVFTAAGGSIGPFRYLVLYNDTVSGDPLIGYWDAGSNITLADTESYTLTITSAGIVNIV